MSTARKNASVLWSYFEKDNAVKKAKCSLCKDIFSYKSTTANLRIHLKRKHIGTYTSLMEEGNLVLPQFQKGHSDQKMRARRKITPRQIDILLKFAESNRDIALGRLTGSLGRQATWQAWVSVTNKLNAVAEGSTKTPAQWRRYWIDFKTKVRSKTAVSRRNDSATGGRPSKLIRFTHAEERVLAIISTEAVDDLPGVRLPLDIHTAEGTQRPVTSKTVQGSRSTATSMPHSSSPYPISPEPEMDVEWLEEEIPSSIEVQFPEPSSSNPLLPDSEPSATQSDNQPEVTSRGERPHFYLTLPRSTSRRQMRRERVPRWAYDLEERRIANEERMVSAMETMVELIRDIRDKIVSHISDNST